MLLKEMNIVICYNMKKLENILLSQKKRKEKKKTNTKGHKLYDAIYMDCPGQTNPHRQKID